MKSSKRQTTQYNHYSKALSQIKDLYSKAKIYKMTSHAITTEYIAIEASVNKKLNQYYNGLLSGYANCEMDKLWDCMEFCYDIDGVLYTTDKNKDQKSNKPNWRTLSDYNMKGRKCAHYWINTDKPYTEISEA